MIPVWGITTERGPIPGYFETNLFTLGFTKDKTNGKRRTLTVMTVW